MAVNKNNDVVKGASGKFGDMIVFRQKGAKTLMTKAPIPTGAAPTNPQEKVRGNFKKAIRYAKLVIADPVLKAMYKAAATGNQSAYNVAFKDLLEAPEILAIDVSAYNGTAGSIISITATDAFKVNAVGVQIEHPDGSLAESGAAIQEGDSDYWNYTATTDNLNLVGLKISVSAVDLPKNVTTKETIL